MELNNLKTESAKLRMTPAEKTAMKARLFGAPSPTHMSPRQSPYFIFTYQFMQARILAPMAVLLVVFLGAGTAAAAQGSLPGDVLYPVKLSVNEAVEVALATTPVAKAQTQAQLAVRRVEEAEVLAAQGTLTPSTSATLAANFETHAQQAEVLADDVSTQDPDTAASLKADLGSSLAAHSAILATLGQEGATAQDDQSSQSLATRVLARADAGRALAAAKVMTLSAVARPAKMQVTFSAKIAATDATNTQEASTSVQEPGPMDAVQERAAAKIQTKAQAAIIDARGTFEDSKDDLDASTTAQVNEELGDIDRMMVEGAQALDANDYAQATTSFTQALSSSIKLSTLLMVQERIQKNIVSPVLEDHLIINSDDDASGSAGVHILPLGL